jgi:hypothetical protein
VYDLVVEAGSPEATEFAPAMDETTGILPDLPAVAGKVVHVAFDGGRLTSDGGILLLAAIEGAARDRRTLGRLHRGPASARAGAAWLAEMIRYRALLIAAGYPDGNNCDALKADPAFKMPIRRASYRGDIRKPVAILRPARRPTGHDPPVPD